MMKKLLGLLLFLIPIIARGQQINNLSPNFSPSTVSPYTLTVNGSGFTNDAVVMWQSTQLQTTFVNQYQLTATVPCCLSYGVSTIQVTVAQSSGTSPSSIFKNLGTYAPITSYKPKSFTQGVGVSLTVNGNYFTPGSKIYFDNIPQNTTFVSQYQLTANISGGSIDGRHTHSVFVQYPVVTSSIRLSPASLNFGSVTVGNAPQLTVTVANLTSSPITISSIVKTGAAEFGQTNSCSSPLAASASCTVTITFTPLNVGNYAGQVTITDSGIGSPHVISFSGIGVGPPTCCAVASFNPASLSFGSVAVGGSAGPTTLTLINNGNIAMTITSVALASGTNYSITDHCVAASPLASLGTCTVDVTFSPLSAGPLTTTLNFTNNAPNSPQKVPLSGTGTSTHHMDVTWVASVSSGVTGYNVYRGTVSGGPYSQINGALVIGTSYTDNAVSSGQQYCYVITAFAPTGYSPQESVHSTESCATIP